MPDEWEKTYGLNPEDASDRNGYSLDSKGYYTNLEVYCNSLVEEQIKSQRADALTEVEGYFEEYFPTPTPSGIADVTIDSSRGKDISYNLQGQRVNGSHKGIVIRNNRKFFQ